jgi:DNA-binding CsgD family transcriptional regulator
MVPSQTTADSSAPARQRTLLFGTEQLAQTGSWDWDLRTGKLTWSDNMFRLLGLEPRAITPSVDLLIGLTHPDDATHLSHEVAVPPDLLPWQVDYRIVRPDGEVRHLRSTLLAVERSGGQPSRLIGSVQDLTERLRAEREIAAHAAVSEALREWTSFDEGGALLIRRLAEAMEFETGALWTVQGDVLTARVRWSTGAFDLAEFDAGTRALRLPRGCGLPGYAWGAREAVSVIDLIGGPGFCSMVVPRREAAVRAGLRGALSVPALNGRDVLAVLEFYSREEVELTDRLLRSFSSIGHELGRFLAGRIGELQPPALTARETEVLQLAAHGVSGPEIAELLVLSPATVKTHFEHIYPKLGVGDRAGAVAAALRLGLIQ